GIIRRCVSSGDKQLADRMPHPSREPHQHRCRRSRVAVQPERNLLLADAHPLGELVGQEWWTLLPHILNKKSGKRTVVVKRSPFCHFTLTPLLEDQYQCKLIIARWRRFLQYITDFYLRKRCCY